MNDLAIKFTCDCSNTNMRFLGYNKITSLINRSFFVICVIFSYNITFIDGHDSNFVTCIT